MSLVWNAIKNLFKFLGSIFTIIWQLIKFILVRCWKFILLIGSIFLTLFSVKKASKGD